MRTNIVIDDELMAQALKATGLDTKKEVVEQGLKLLIKRSKQQSIRSLRGKIKYYFSLVVAKPGVGRLRREQTQKVLMFLKTFCTKLFAVWN